MPSRPGPPPKISNRLTGCAREVHPGPFRQPSRRWSGARPTCKRKNNRDERQEAQRRKATVATRGGNKSSYLQVHALHAHNTACIPSGCERE